MADQGPAARSPAAKGGAPRPVVVAAPAAPLVVVGMHRSGTSLVASLVGDAGVSVGRRLVGPAPDNPRGYFEDAEFVEFHERCLARRARTYADPGPPVEAFEPAERAEAQALVERRRADGGPWGWKDPRTCLFLHAWRALVPDARYLVVHRHPLEVLASLLRRGERVALADAWRGLEMYTSYSRAVLDFLDASHPPAAVVEAGAAFDAPEEFCKALAGVGAAVRPEQVRKRGAPAEFRRLPGLRDLAGLLEWAHPGAAEAHRRLVGVSSVLAGAPPAADARAAGAARALAQAAACAGEGGDPPAALRHSLLVAGLCVLDPGLAARLSEVSIEREVLAEREVARRNHERAVHAEAAAAANLARAEAAEAGAAAAEKSAAENYGRALAAEAASKENYERALAAEAASKENYDRALRAEAAAAEQLARAETAESVATESRDSAEANYQRALAAEAASKDNYDRALAAEAASKENYERALKAEAAAADQLSRAQTAEEYARGLRATGDLLHARWMRARDAIHVRDADLKALLRHLREARRRIAALTAELGAAQAQAEDRRLRVVALTVALADEKERRAAAETRGASDRALLAEARFLAARESARASQLAARVEEARSTEAQLRRDLHEMWVDRNRYRKRWPPYAARRAVQIVTRRLAGTPGSAQPPEAAERFGLHARVGVFLTGLPGPDEAPGVAAALERQSRAVDLLVTPAGDAALRPAGPVRAVRVKSWWAPDLPGLLEGLHYALLTHPERYGPGPLWNPVALELGVAALAGDPALSCVLYRGAPGEPSTGTPNHLYETDAATIEQWPDETLAAIFRSGELARAWGNANPGETRDIRAAVLELIQGGRRVLVAPRTFPLEGQTAQRVASDLGGRAPAQARGAINALYVTQWLECGGADKGAVDLLTRADPSVVNFGLMTTVASSHAWEGRVRGHVREIVHLGDHLPLPPEERFPRFLVEHVRRRNIGLVHIMHSFLGYDALPALKRALPGVKVLDQCHVLEPASNMEGGHPAYSSRRYRDYLDHRTVTSRWLRDHLVREFAVPEERISVIYTGVDTREEFDPARHRPGQLRARLGIGEGTRLVVFLGRLHWQKRPWLFARIAGEVQRRAPEIDAAFVLVGPGDERTKVEAIRAELPRPERLVLAGEVGHSGPVLRDAALLLMPSAHEGLAYVSYEAMAMGVPQVFTDVNGQRELITPDTGVLIPPDEDRVVEHGAEAVIDLLRDEDKRAAMGRAARERVEREFGIDTMVRRYEELYRRLTGVGA